MKKRAKRMWRKLMRNNGYIIKHIILGAIIALLMLGVGYVEGTEYEPFTYPEKHEATVEVVVTLDNGNQYVVEVDTTTATVNTYGSDDPSNWEIVKW